MRQERRTNRVPHSDTGDAISGLPDGNGNFVLTEIQVTTFPDCNGNGVDDADDIAGGTSEDLDENGIPDECEDTLVATPVWAKTYDHGYGDDMVWASLPSYADEWGSHGKPFYSKELPTLLGRLLDEISAQ